MFGLECFLSQHNGFDGVIKRSWQDFQVTEIDECGKWMKLTSVDLPPPFVKSISNEDQSGLDALKNRQGKSWTAKRVEGETETGKAMQVPNLPHPSRDEAMEVLKRELGVSQVLMLEQLAEKLWEMETSQETLSLGAIAEKSKRAVIHLNSRVMFPFMKTSTVKNKDGHSEVLVGRDPVYWEFLRLLEDREQVDKFICFTQCVNKRTSASYNLPVKKDKKHRTLIHRLIAKHYGSFLETKTFTPQDHGWKQKKVLPCGDSYIQARVRVKLSSKKTHPASSSQDYTGFVLYKRNLETLEAIQRLAQCLSTHPSAFSYAGIKDSKAATTQFAVVRGITPEQLHAVSEHPSLDGITTGNYSRGATPIRMGQLSGNHFIVIIREVSCEPAVSCQDAIEEAVCSVKCNGFVNYFGVQRFGAENRSVSACDVGLAMLKGDTVKAVQLLLTPSGDDPLDPVDNAKRYFQETGDVPGTLDRMPVYKTRERMVLKSLHRHGTDSDGYTKSLMNIPYSMRLLYVHSYCSFLWNHLASYRLQRYGSAAVVHGDLVFEKSPRPDSTQDSALPTAVDSTACSTADVCTDSFVDRCVDRRCVRVVESRDIQEETYTLRDVVLPLPGYNAQYPANDVGTRYEEKLKADGLTPGNFRMRKLGLNVPGAHRKLIAFPKNLHWKWLDIEDEESGLLTELETNSEQINTREISSCDKEDVGPDCDNGGRKRGRLSAEDYLATENSTTKRLRTVGVAEGKESSDSCANARELSDLNFSSHQKNSDVELSFTLEPSSYATVCLRELKRR